MVQIDGGKLRTLRERRLMTLDELSGKSGVAYSTIWGIETGRQAPRPSTLRRILAVLEASPEDVFVPETEGDETGKAAA